MSKWNRTVHYFFRREKIKKIFNNVFTHKWIRIMREYIKIKFSLFLGVSIKRENFRYEN